MCHVPVCHAGWSLGANQDGMEITGASSVLNTKASWTGITVVNTVSKSAIDVSISDNDSGEHYPLVYVLICQKL